MIKTVAAIEAMLDALYLAKRDLQSSGETKEPYFVWLTTSEEHRHHFEKVILAYLVEKYGFDPAQIDRKYDMNPCGENQTTFSFPQHGFRLSIINLKHDLVVPKE